MFCCHRINTSSELKNIPIKYGIEVDLRDGLNGCIHLSHDPFVIGELFDTFLNKYMHAFIILNIKSERIEYKILDILKKFNICNYFFLDSSFPMIYKLSCEGEQNISVRFSELESIDTVMKLRGKIKWVWIDCFTKNPLTHDVYTNLKKEGFKLCFVSPELQNQNSKIEEYRDYFQKNNIHLDMICTKSYNIDRWIKKDVQIIIPMSGVGQRFTDAGYTLPKPLIIVDKKPIIEHVVNLFPNETNIKFICNSKHLQESNMRSVLKNIRPLCDIFEVPTNGRMGPVHAVSLIYDNINDVDEVIISYCDYGTYWDYYQFLKDARERNADGSIACYIGFHPHMLGSDNYAFVKESENMPRYMDCIQEKKPFTNNRMSEYASNGTYYFKSGLIMKKYFSTLMELGEKVNNEYYVSMVYNLMKKDGLIINIFEINNMLQWGTPYDLKIYNEWSNYFSNIVIKQTIINDAHNTTLILPMAGAGTRFSCKGYTKPKPLLNVCNSPMIIQAVRCLPETSQKIFICLDEHVKHYNVDKIINSEYSNCNVFPIDFITNGQACTTEIGITKSNISMDSSILISACDNGVYYNKSKYKSLLDDDTIDIIVWTFRNNPTSINNPDMYAWVQTDDNDNVLNVSCKKFNKLIHNIKDSHVIIGTMFFRKASYFIDGFKQNCNENVKSNGEFYVDDVINQNIKSGLKIKVFEVDNYICWGTPNDYETYVYWQQFFDKCNWHKYKIHDDVTNLNNK